MVPNFAKTILMITYQIINPQDRDINNIEYMGCVREPVDLDGQ